MISILGRVFVLIALAASCFGAVSGISSGVKKSKTGWMWSRRMSYISFFAMSIIGTVGIVLVDWPWILPYIFINWYGIPGIAMRHLICPRCPHLYKYGDCLQLHPKATKWIVKKQKRFQSDFILCSK